MLNISSTDTESCCSITGCMTKGAISEQVIDSVHQARVFSIETLDKSLYLSRTFTSQTLKIFES